jgi:hypothetical protein
VFSQFHQLCLWLSSLSVHQFVELLIACSCTCLSIHAPMCSLVQNKLFPPIPHTVLSSLSLISGSGPYFLSLFKKCDTGVSQAPPGHFQSRASEGFLHLLSTFS